MTRRPFGSTGRDVPVIGQGTWMMEKTPEASLKALRRGLEEGMTHIDTAEMYGSGAAEEIVGKAIRGRREDVFLVSKVLPTNATYAGTLQACERSLRRLETDHLDVYLLHWLGDVPMEETFRAFEKLKKDGKILAYGVSNFDIDELEEAKAIVGADSLACNQVYCSLTARAAESRVLPWCQENGVAFVAYSPLGQGDFPSPRGAAGKALARVAERHEVTPQQIALAFLTREPGTFAIPKAANVDHVTDNAEAAEIQLTDAEIDAIAEAFPVGRSKRLPMI